MIWDHMGRTARSLLIALISAAVVTGATFFVGEFVVASVPGVPGAGGSADVYGFPIPYATFFSCCLGAGGTGYSVILNNTYFYNPLALLADYAIWLAISVVAVSTFTVRRIFLSAAMGAGITIATLLLAPLSIVAPTPAMGAVLKPMGFPYDYLVYYVSGFPEINNPAGYEFYLPPLLADIALWTGLACAIVGIVAGLLQMRQRRLLALDHPVQDPRFNIFEPTTYYVMSAEENEKSVVSLKGSRN